MAVTPKASKGAIRHKRTSKTDVTVSEGDLDFKTIAEASLSGILVLQDERIVYVNPAAVEMLGYTKDELLGMRFLDVIHPDFRDMGREYALRRLMGEPAASRIDIKIVGKDGRERWNDSFTSRIEYKGRPAVLVTAMDITERKQAEDALRKNEKFLNNVFNCIQDGVSVLSKDLSVIRYNPTIEKWHGKDLTGKKCYRLFHGREEPCETCPSVRAIREKTMQREVVHDLIGWKEIYAYPLVNDDGEVTGTIEQVRDITERKQAENALREAKVYAENLIETANVIVLGLDIEGKVNVFNKAAEVITGYSREEIIGKSWELVVPRDCYGFVWTEFDRLMDGGIPKNFENPVLTKSGEERYIVWQNNEICRNGQIVSTISFGIDITERKRAEEALWESEARYKLVVAGAHGAIWDWNVPNKRIFLSPQWKALRGLSEDEVTDREEEWSSRIHPEDAPRVLAAIQAHFEGRTPIFAEEYRTCCKDGSWLWVFDRGMAQRDAAGHVVHMAGSETDITERKRAEEALSKNLAVLAKSQEIAHLGSWSIDFDSDKFEISDETYRMHGLEPGTVEPTLELSLKLTHPDDLERYMEFVESIRREGRLGGIDYRIVWPDGSVHYVHATSDNVIRGPDGRVKMASGITQDITERKQAEEGLQKSEEKYRCIVETANEGILVIDRDLKTTFINDKLLSMLGYTTGEIYGKKLGDFVLDLDLSIFHSQLDRHLGGLKVRPEIRLRRKDGSHLWCIVSATPLLDDKGDYAGGIAMITDITERKHAEEALKEAKAQAELYLDLMGHDINNMHQIALGYMEMAQDMLPAAGESEFLEKPIEVLQRSAQLIKNVRKLQKLHDGMFQTELIDVSEVLADVQRELGAVPHKAIRLNMNGSERCRVRANELLHDVFANLVSNAIKHTGDRADIDIGLKVVNDNGGRYCHVSVEDNGPGIPDDFKARIFNRMLKGTNKAKGMGLGLYLVKSLVDSYGGRVWVEDRITGDHTKGARFVVMLPAIEK